MHLYVRNNALDSNNTELHTGVEMTTPIIEVRNVSLDYQTSGGWLTALSELNLSIERGQFVSVIGPSGCGKSTLLSVVGGLIPPTTGEVIFEGRPLRAPSERIGVAFQDAVLLPWCTVLENVLLPARVKGARAEAEKRARELLATVGLEGFEHRYPKELSGGMRQRVAIARALTLDPEVLLMDEPFGALDAMTRERMGFELLRIWQGSQKTVLFITHGISEAVLLSDRVIVMGARPARVIRDITIPLPRPRSLESLEEPSYAEAARELRSLLMPMG